MQNQETANRAPAASPPYHPFTEDDFLWRQLKTVPAFRALLRAVESRFYQQVTLPAPTLDMGCGDGHFAEMTFTERLAVGLDPWWGPLQKAKRSAMYSSLIHGLGDRMPFPDNSFGSAMSNSVLEHIPNIQAVLNEMSRVMKPNAPLVITVPSHYFTEYLGGAAALQKVGLGSLANSYRKGFNLISRHAHTDGPEIWAERLATAGFEITRWQYYFSQSALRALEWGHLQGLPAAIMHFLTGHWILAPWESSLRRTEAWLRPFYEEEATVGEGAYLLFVARKVQHGPIPTNLPPPQPFPRAALRDHPPAQAPQPQQALAALRSPTPDAPEYGDERDDQTGETAVTPPPTPPQEQFVAEPPTTEPPSAILPLLGITMSLLSAFIGQFILNRQPESPAGGLRWYAVSGGILLFLAWRSRVVRLPALPSLRLPRMQQIAPRRWLIVGALLLALLPGQMSSPTFALFTWLLAVGIAFYALSNFDPTPPAAETAAPLHIPRFTLVASILLFLAAAAIRYVNLGTHPFILNGTEASLGLDILNINRGLVQSPFGTGWLTNPSLPLYLMAVPVRLLGQTTFALRFLSPLVGALTVVATFWFGSLLWRREVGLIAAVLLAGSHFHLHYSRMGLTNIYDPLLALLAFGLLAYAWRSDSADVAQRDYRWLAAGAVVGLNSYLFTSSRLLLLALPLLFASALLFARRRLLAHLRPLLKGALLALVVALPLLLVYNGNPTLFNDRFNSLGIFANQTNWLADEAVRTGESEGALLLQQLWHGLLGLNYRLDTSPSYRPPVPLLGFGTAVFFMLGLMMAVGRWRRWPERTLVIWFGVTAVFGGALLLEPPASHRLLVALPAVALLAALGMWQIGRFVLRLIHEAEMARPELDTPSSALLVLQRWLLPFLLLLALLFAVSETTFYFGRYRSEHNFADRNTEIANSMADYLNSLDGNQWTVYFYGPPHMYIGFPTIPYLTTGFTAEQNLFDVPPEQSSPPVGSGNLLFIFLPERMAELAPVRTQYPNGTEQTFAGFYANPLFYVYEVRQP